MPYGAVRLLPGVNTERTATLNETGVTQSSLIRYKDSLIQKYGGWTRYYPFAVSGTPRDLHAWEDLNNTGHLLVGTTTQLGIITSGMLTDITPQTFLSDFAPDFTTVISTPTVTIVDPNISNVTTFDSIIFNTPVSVGGLILSGAYAITLVTGATSYTITAAANATSSVSNAGAVPTFTTTTNSAIVEVGLTAHGLSVGSIVVFPIATTGNGVTVSGRNTVTSIVDANNFDIVVSVQATGTGSFSMNSGNAELLYYINLGPTPAGFGYGLGLYGAGLYGFGTSGGSSQVGTPITATDWTSDNWGEIALANPKGGGVYQYDPTAGFTNAALIQTAPPFNNGIFISNQQEILVCYGSTTTQDIGIELDPLQINWSTIGDFTNFTPSTTNQAGGFRIPNGSKIVAGISVANNDLIWTDLDLWAMNYVGFPNVFGFSKIGAGAGAISSHAVQPLRGNVYWMGNNNFYAYNTSGVSVLPCSVWDFVFQNINTSFTQNVRAMPNTPFNEAGWLFPSSASTSGECDSYVKMNITEPNTPWDFGPADALPRSAWIDQSLLGMPISASSAGIIYQQETTNDADGGALTPSFTTGYFFLAEGEDFVIVNQILPDFKWGTYAGAQTASVQMTFNVVDFPGDTPTMFGPYTVTQSTKMLTMQMRGRQMSITISSADAGSFWRIGRVRYRWAPSGRR